MQPGSLEREVLKSHYNMWAKFLFRSLCWPESNTITAVIPFVFLPAFFFCVQLSISSLILARLFSILAKSFDYLSCPAYE